MKHIKAWIAIFIGGLLIGAMILGWIFMVGPALNQASYNNYNTSPQHLQAAAQEFSDDCLLLSQTKELLVRKAIEQDIDSVASTVDLSKVEMPHPTRTCVQKAIFDVTH